MVAELILGILGSWIAEYPAGTSADMGLTARIDVRPRGCLQRVCCVRGVDIDAVGAVMPRKTDVFKIIFKKILITKPINLECPVPPVVVCDLRLW